ncbi:hypothetical protein H8958_019026 [Nasalis larvatus]
MYDESGQCMPIKGLGFVLGAYECICKAGFYHPGVLPVNNFRKLEIVSVSFFFIFVINWIDVGAKLILTIKEKLYLLGFRSNLSLITETEEPKIKRRIDSRRDPDQHISGSTKDVSEEAYVCLPCREGCPFCADDSPCFIQEDKYLRLAIISFQALCMLLDFISMLVVYHFRKAKDYNENT